MKKTLQFGIESNMFLALELQKYVAYPARSLALCDALSNASAAVMCIHVWFPVMERALSCMCLCVGDFIILFLSLNSVNDEVVLQYQKVGHAY